MAARTFTLRLASRLVHRTILSPTPSLSSLHHHHHRHRHYIFSSTSLLRNPQFFFSSSARRNPKKVDIGARARKLQTRRLWTYALTFAGVAGFVILVLNNFQDQLVFYVTPSDALEKYRASPSRNKFRLGGLVLEGSVHQPPSSPEMEFVVTDLITDILVRYQGSLPDLFREGHSVVVEGLVKPLTDEIRAVGMSEKCKEVMARARSGEYYFAATGCWLSMMRSTCPRKWLLLLRRTRRRLMKKWRGRRLLWPEIFVSTTATEL